MNGIYRVLRMTLRYRLTLAGVFLSSLFMSILWSANIGVVYPFMEVVFVGKTMQEWARDEVIKLDSEIVAYKKEVETSRQSLAGATTADRAPLENKIALLEDRIDATQRAVHWMRRIQPWVNRYVPDTAFRTL